MMFSRLIAFLNGPPQAPRPLPEADSRHLLGALLVRMAAIDGVLQRSELQAIDRLFARQFGLDPVAAARLRAECERLAEALPPTETLGPLLSLRLTREDRNGLLSALTEIATADGDLRPGETQMAEAVQSILDANPAV